MMKRVFALALAALLALAAVPALADPDPIVGAWYADSTDGTTHIVTVYVFDAAGGVTLMMLDFEPSGYSARQSVEPVRAGSWWQRSAGVYAIISSMSGAYYARADLHLDGDRLYIPSTNGKYWAFRRMERFAGDVYTDAEIGLRFGR